MKELLFEKHVFICTNQREAGARVCCGEERGFALVSAFKKAIRDHGISAEVRAQRTGCFDICEHGPNVMVYPEGTIYAHVQLSDVEEITLQHLKNGKPVERLVLSAQEARKKS
jgi:(2Fe-2S) ferredoxin